MKEIIFLMMLVLSGFISRSQTFCDSLLIKDISFAYFNDSTIVVEVENNSTQLFAYPGFVIINAQNDTVAKEKVNYFGIGNTQTHYLQILDTTINSELINSSLQIWTGFYDTLLCSYQMDIQLCNDSCSTVYPFIANYGGAININQYNWRILDSDSSVIANSIFILDSQNQFDQDTICLLPGKYVLEIDDYVHTGGQIWSGMNMNSASGFSVPTYPMGFSFDFWFSKNCESEINFSEFPVLESDLKIRVIGQEIYFVNTKQQNIGSVKIIDITGRSITEVNSVNTTQGIPVSNLNKGYYFLLLEDFDPVQVIKFMKY